MHGNKLLILTISLFAIVYGAPDDRRKFVRVITEPKPGEEYVSIHTGKPSSGAVQEKLSGNLGTKTYEIRLICTAIIINILFNNKITSF